MENAKISDVSLRSNDSGYTVNYEKKVPRVSTPMNAEFDEPYRNEYKTESFSEDDADKAFDRFKELAGKKS